MQSEEDFKPILGGFVPLKALWHEGSPAPLTFPSEVSARWYVRTHREHLVQASAIMTLRGRTYIHPERFGEALLRAGIAAAAKFAHR